MKVKNAKLIEEARQWEAIAEALDYQNSILYTVADALRLNGIPDTASYALKLLQSEGEVTIASTGKDESTGDLTTKEYKVEGPVMLFLTTTAIDIDEELMNRCLVLSVNESSPQTQAIQQRQRENQTLDGLIKVAQKGHCIKVHQNAQRLLRPLKVVNPYAEQLTFRSDQTRTRRDHMKYLTLIQSIALLHQYQREIKTVKHNDIEVEFVVVQIRHIASQVPGVAGAAQDWAGHAQS